jgi:alpha-D-ribose 1-methylphosphonate 5-triphosphate synthase subunit PhnH
MKAPDLQHIAAGFSHEAFGSQAVFRAALDALSHPGRPLQMPTDCALPKHGQPAAAALMLGLVDADTRLWLSPALAQSDAAPWLRFHTGCQIVSKANDAHFVWVALGDAMPPLNSLRLGSDAYPDQSATCVIETLSLHADVAGWTLQGPGIQNQRQLQVTGLTPDFTAQWQHNHDSFPRGLDVFLTTPTHVVGLPRTTRILNTQEA